MSSVYRAAWVPTLLAVQDALMSVMLLLLPLTLSGQLGPEVEMRTLEGETVTGKMADITSEAITLDADGQRSTHPISGLESLRVLSAEDAADVQPAAWVTLVDGSLLVASAYRVANAEAAAEVELVEGPFVEIPTRLLRHVRFKEQGKSQATQWAEALKANAAGDLLVIRKGQKLDYIEGVLGAVSADKVDFVLEGDLIPVGREKVEGLIYARGTDSEIQASRGTLIDRTGSRIEVAALRRLGTTLRIETAAGVELRRDWNQVAAFDFTAENVLYLSQMTPTEIDWRPYFVSNPDIAAKLRGSYLPRRDRALAASSPADSALRLRYYRDETSDEIKEFARGLAIASRTTLTFELPADARRFKAIAGIDARMVPRGHVHLVIDGDDKRLFEQSISGTKSPRQIDLDVSGVTELKILVDFGEQEDIGDHLNLCEARIVK
ncbi:MAG: hypothetical protein DWQ35_15395 [Planctomycetota bacterium]|nr:MAG: hypothetical protein DWQ35_15395 [Planctomycetota bacterium]